MDTILKKIFKSFDASYDLIISSFIVKADLQAESLKLTYSHLHDSSFVCVFDLSVLKGAASLLVCQNLQMTAGGKEQAKAIAFFKIKSVDLDHLADRIDVLKKELFLISELDDQL